MAPKKTVSPATTVSPSLSLAADALSEKLRGWWWSKQALDGRLAGRTPRELLRETGWARSVGGVNPYLTIWSRGGGGRVAIDAAAAEREILELPSARGCTYVVPADDFALALAVGASKGESADVKLARKLGASDEELSDLCDSIEKLVAKQPRDPAELRAELGDEIRNFGPEGKKRGLTSTLTVALGMLQAAGRIYRVSVNGRFDQERYRYVAWKDNPLKKSKLDANYRDPEFAATELARRYFRWIGPATLGEFQWFLGFGVKVVKDAIAPLGLEPLTPGSDRLLLPDEREAWERFRPAKQPQYALIGSLDGLSLLRRDLARLLDPADRERQVHDGDSGLRAAGGLSDLPSHALADRGRIVGFWEYDVERRELVWLSFVKATPALKAAVRAAEEFVRDELGDARTFSLDSPKSRGPRIAALRAAALESTT